MNVQELSHEYAQKHSNKGCTEACAGCWQQDTPLGCEQYHIQQAYLAGANDVIQAVEATIQDAHNRGAVLWTGSFVEQKIKELKGE